MSSISNFFIQKFDRESFLNKLNDFTESCKLISDNEKSIKRETYKMGMDEDYPADEVLERINLKLELPQLKGCFLSQDNKRVNLSAAEIAIYSIFAESGKMNFDLNCVLNEVYPGKETCTEKTAKFKRTLFNLNKKIRNAFGFKNLFNIKKKQLRIEKEMVIKTQNT